SALSKRLPEGLAGDLERARRQGRPLTLLLAESDPGYDILKLFAPRQTSAGMRDGMLNLHWIENANHGFSKKVMQDRLITRFLALDLIT
ncbi:MAG: hypothetical protein KDI19_05290, partial [Pseudomonadales bacterium]|nr:hypothetical protein [Pseudomonadales bacterium]